MKTPASLFVALIGLMALGALCTGCSLLGLAVDSSGQPDTLAVGPEEKTLEGKIVLVTLREGYSFAGECRRLGDLPQQLYRSRFAQWRETSGKTVLPVSLGDTLHILWGHGRISVGTLAGFTRASIVVLPLPTSTAPFPRPSQVLSLPVEEIDSLWTPNGTGLHGSVLQTRLGEGSIPTTSAMLVRSAGNSAWVPLEEIVQISEIRHSYEWFHAGAFADAAGLVAVLVYFAGRDH